MQARLEIRRLPTMLLVIVLAVLAALVLGGALGYALKPNSAASSPTRVIVVPNSQQVSSGAGNDCVIVDKHKAC